MTLREPGCIEFDRERSRERGRDAAIDAETNAKRTYTVLELHSVFCFIDEYGGAFAKSLAAAWLLADMNNKAKIESTWSDLVEKYYLAARTVGRI